MTTPYIETADYWTQVEGEEERVRTFARIPDGWEGETDQLPEDDEVFYWLDAEEWVALGTGDIYGDAEVLACACDQCESERYAEHWEREVGE